MDHVEDLKTKMRAAQIDSEVAELLKPAEIIIHTLAPTITTRLKLLSILLAKDLFQGKADDATVALVTDFVKRLVEETRNNG
jgi:hypothetical protein